LSNPELKQHLEAFIPRYTQQTKTSKSLRQCYRPVFADTQSSGRLAKFLLSLKEINYPIIETKAIGSRLWDIDGNEYCRYQDKSSNHFYSQIL